MRRILNSASLGIGDSGKGSAAGADTEMGTVSTGFFLRRSGGRTTVTVAPGGDTGTCSINHKKQRKSTVFFVTSACARRTGAAAWSEGDVSAEHCLQYEAGKLARYARGKPSQ